MKNILILLLGILIGLLISYTVSYSSEEPDEKIENMTENSETKNVIAESLDESTELQNVIIENTDESTEVRPQAEKDEKIYTHDKRITLFENIGDCVTSSDLLVSSVDEEGNAIAEEVEYLYDNSFITKSYGITVLILAKEGDSYYDNQLIKIRNGRCAKQLGIFTGEVSHKVSTIPVVKIVNK